MQAVCAATRPIADSTDSPIRCPWRVLTCLASLKSNPNSVFCPIFLGIFSLVTPVVPVLLVIAVGRKSGL